MAQCMELYRRGATTDVRGKNRPPSRGEPPADRTTIAHVAAIAPDDFQSPSTMQHPGQQRAHLPVHAASFGASENYRRCPEAEPSPKVQRTHSRARDHCPRRGNRPGRFSVPLKNAAARAAACLPAHAASFGASENHRRCPTAEPSPTLPRSPSQADGSHRPAFGMTSPQGSGACSGTLPGLPSSRARTLWHCAKVVGRPPHSRAPHRHCAMSGCVPTTKKFTHQCG